MYYFLIIKIIEELYIFLIQLQKNWKKKNINESFILSQNCIKLLKFENIKDIKILICGIKKYYQEQKNGFIIFKIKSEDNELIFENFIYDTDNYIINSFLSLKKLNKNNFIFIKKNNKIYNTKYIFVSGSNEENEDNQIENRLYYIDEIENNKPQKEFTKINFSNIKPIKDSFKMFQSEINGNLFIISSDDKLNEFEVNYQSLM